MKHAEHNQEHAGHERGDGQTLEAVLLDDAIYNNNERARGTAYLHLRASKNGDEQTGHDGGDNTLLGSDTRGNAEGNSQGEGDDAHNDTCQQVCSKLLLAVVLKRLDQLGPEL